MMKAWHSTLTVVALSVLSLGTTESTCFAAAANLVVMQTNPNGAPTNGGTQFLLGLQVTGIAAPTFLGSNEIDFTGNVGNATPTVAGSYYTAGKALFQSEADAANGVGGYSRVNDSYFASPWKSLLASPSGAGETVPKPLFIDAGVYGAAGPYQVPSNGTYAFAYINVTNSPTGFVDIMGEFAIGLEHAPIGTGGGGLRLTSAGQLQSLVQLRGDYNANGIVDAADYVIWRDKLGQTFTLNGVNPSAATPTVVDQEDYTYWRSRFGATTNSGSGSGSGLSVGAVPEPASLTLLALGLTLAASHRARRKNGQIV